MKPNPDEAHPKKIYLSQKRSNTKMKKPKEQGFYP
jgi:hypothetical protein